MPRDVVATLDSIVCERSLLKHPFYQDWTAGTLSMERLQNYAVDYFAHYVQAFSLYLERDSFAMRRPRDAPGDPRLT